MNQIELENFLKGSNVIQDDRIKVDVSAIYNGYSDFEQLIGSGDKIKDKYSTYYQICSPSSCDILILIRQKSTQKIVLLIFIETKGLSHYKNPFEIENFFQNKFSSLVKKFYDTSLVLCSMPTKDDLLKKDILKLLFSRKKKPIPSICYLIVGASLNKNFEVVKIYEYFNQLSNELFRQLNHCYFYDENALNVEFELEDAIDKTINDLMSCITSFSP